MDTARLRVEIDNIRNTVVHFYVSYRVLFQASFTETEKKPD